jgi:hypothetical protein
VTPLLNNLIFVKGKEATMSNRQALPFGHAPDAHVDIEGLDVRTSGAPVIILRSYSSYLKSILRSNVPGRVTMKRWKMTMKLLGMDGK